MRERRVGSPVIAAPLRDDVIRDFYSVFVPRIDDAATAHAAAIEAGHARGVEVDPAVGHASAVALTRELLASHGQALKPADRDGLLAAEVNVILEVEVSPTALADRLRASAEIARATAASVGGWIRDEMTGEIFTLASFDRRRPVGFALQAWR